MHSASPGLAQAFELRRTDSMKSNREPQALAEKCAPVWQADDLAGATVLAVRRRAALA